MAKGDSSMMGALQGAGRMSASPGMSGLVGQGLAARLANPQRQIQPGGVNPSDGIMGMGGKMHSAPPMTQNMGPSSDALQKIIQMIQAGSIKPMPYGDDGMAMPINNNTNIGGAGPDRRMLAQMMSSGMR